jgi:hypothetical protein
MTSIAEMKAAVLAAGALPAPTTSTLLGQEVNIRAFTGTEEAAYLSENLSKGAIPICAACIIDGHGQPVFTKEELGSLRAGSLKQVYSDILALSYPDAKALGNGSSKTRGSRSASS